MKRYRSAKTTPRPLHPYGVSKFAQDLLAAQYFDNYSLPSIRLRIVPTTGPGKIGDVCSDLTRRAVEIRFGLQPRPMQVGNLKSRRAILDVRDLVRPLWLAGEYCEPGKVYNVGADRIFSVTDIIGELRAQLGFHFDIEQRRELMRTPDEPVIAGDNAKFRKCCAWTPDVPLSTTLKDMLNLVGHEARRVSCRQRPDA